MLDSKQERCQDCMALVEGDNKEWICDECGKEIHEVDECPEGVEDENTADD
jgi:predicted amidophosphoribosyltransferase